MIVITIIIVVVYFARVDLDLRQITNNSICHLSGLTPGCTFNCVNCVIFSRAGGVLNYLRLSDDDVATETIIKSLSPLKVGLRRTFQPWSRGIHGSQTFS